MKKLLVLFCLAGLIGCDANYEEPNETITVEGNWIVYRQKYLNSIQYITPQSIIKIEKYGCENHLIIYMNGDHYVATDCITIEKLQSLILEAENNDKGSKQK